ncbi:MAG: amidohydrolase [Actinomycetota bacterium]|nr:amidohydrolase [Actinomycetota bacterium]
MRRAPSKPDLILRGLVLTIDPSSPAAEAVAVSRGRISAVGSWDEIQPLGGPRSEVIDVGRRTVLPGFQDAHVHPPQAGLDRMRCDLNDLGTREDYLEAIRAHAAAHPDEPWLLGGGWAMDGFPGGTPDRGLLDAAVPDRPAFLVNRDGHGAWVNTPALELAGIDARTPDPPDGRIERDVAGEPSGMLHEGAMDLVERLLPPVGQEEWQQAILLAQRHLHGLGITAWQDAWVLPETLAAYAALAERGELTARVVAALWWDRGRGEEQVDDLLELRASGSVGRLRAPAVKVMQDGIVENFTAGMIEPYLDGHGLPDDGRGQGLSFVDPAAFGPSVTRLDREGFQVHVHAIGDRAVREALDAFEAARAANGPSPNRHHIAHLQVVHPDDVPRFAALGVAANLQAYWACLDDQMRDLNVPFLGPQRTGQQYPFASLARSGARLALGSDWSVTTADPLRQIQVALTRVPFDQPEREPFLPAERLDLPTALRAFTMGSAWVNHLDRETGSIEPGKLADLVVLDRDLTALSPASVGEAQVVLTMVEGEVVRRAPSLSGW